MSEAPRLELDGRRIPLAEGQTVLEALEGAGAPVPSSCRSGVCRTCLVRAVEGEVPARAQAGLKDSLAARGYFLSCVCVPAGDLSVRLAGADLDFEAEVLASDDLGARVRRVRLSAPEGFEWFPGQYATIRRPDGVARSYSIASLPEEGFLELHVRRVPGGAVSGWLHDEAAPGSRVALRGPFGDCFLAPGCEPDAPLLLAGTGTGLAPLWGIAREAVRRGHAGPVRLLHGALDEGGLYHRRELEALAEEHGVDYAACVLRGGGDPARRLVAGSLDEVVLAEPVDLRRARAFLCGDPGLVGRMRKGLFLKGMSNRRIFADAFVPSAGGGGA